MGRRRLLAALLGIVGMAFLSFAQAPTPVALRAGRLFDGTSGKMLTNQVVMIAGDRIAKVGSSQSVTIPPGTRVIDLARATVLPGLLDCHTHTFEHANRWPQYADYDAEVREQSASYRTLQAAVDAKHDLRGWIHNSP